MFALKLVVCELRKLGRVVFKRLLHVTAWCGTSKATVAHKQFTGSPSTAWQELGPLAYDSVTDSMSSVPASPSMLAINTNLLSLPSAFTITVI